MSVIQRRVTKPFETNKENLSSQKEKNRFSENISSPIDHFSLLQRTIGNQAVQRLLKSRAVQAKLSVSQPGDIYEQEADRMAEQVMRMPEPMVQSQPEDEGGRKKLIRRKPLSEQITPLVQRPVEEEEVLQSKNLSGQAPEGTRDIEARTNEWKGYGQPLPESVKNYFEPRFGFDFSQVRLHTDAKAGEIARALKARAFVAGGDIGFGVDEYAPHTLQGRQLFAHELVHVIQQNGKLHASHSDALVQRKKEESAAKKKPGGSEAPKKVLVVEILKTEDMDLTTEEGKVALLSIVIQHILNDISEDAAQAAAEEMVDEFEIEPIAKATFEEIAKEFESAKPGWLFKFMVYRSFLMTLDKYLPVPATLLEAYEEYSVEEVPEKEPPEKPTDCWFPILTKYTAKERRTWALARIAEAVKAGRSRYEPGKAYGNLLFVCHPYAGFLDDQIWMTGDDRLYWINERDCMIEAFRQGVMAAAPMVTLAWVVVGMTTVIAAGLVAAPALIEAGYGLFSWTLANPVTATQIGLVGAEITLSIATGTDLPPITPADEIGFAVATVGKKGVRAGQKILIEVLEGAEPGATRSIKGIVREVEFLDEAALSAWKNGKTVVHIVAPQVEKAATKAIPKAAPGLGRLLPESLNWLAKKGLLDKAKASLSHAGDDIIMAVNRFHDVTGFDLVLKAYLEGGPKQEGARFVMRFAAAHFSEKVGKIAMVFEMPSMPKIGGEAARFVDLFAEGIRYEFKSVKDISAALVKGRTAAEFGQLQKDIIFALGGDLSRLASLRWVFDSKKMLAEGWARADVVKRLGDLLSETELFKGYPLLEKVISSLDKMVVFWP